MKTRKSFAYNRYVFLLKPFLGAITVDVDGKKIFQPEKFTFGTISKINAPLLQICWLNENLLHVISPFDNEEKGIEKWQSHYIGYRSPLLTMYLNENDQIRLERKISIFNIKKAK